MDVESLLRLTSEGLLLCMYVSLPIVAVSALTGLLISFLQAVTSLQDHSLSYGVKLVATAAVTLLLAPWGAAAILRYAKQLVSIAVPT
jgi:type III secretion protein S